jgi:hypothetical protein
MPGFSIGTDLDEDRAIAAALEAARGLGFAVAPVTGREFLARRGSLFKSLLLGPFAPYCKFRVSAVCLEDGASEVVVQRNTPWWTGFTGLRKVDVAALRLAEAVAEALTTAGGNVFSRVQY